MNENESLLKELQSIIEPYNKPFTIHSILSLKGKSSVLSVHCKEHGLGNEWENPWTPTLKQLKEMKQCPKCSGRYNPTEKEALSIFKNEFKGKNSKLKIIDIKTMAKNSSQVVVQCKEHGRSDEWANPWTPKFSQLMDSPNCKKCNGTYSPTKEEAISFFNNDFFNDKPYKIIDIPEYSNHYSRCKIKCEKHGNGWEWGNPWNPTLKDLKHGYGCPKCAGIYNRTKEEVTEQINEVFKNSFVNLVDIPDYKNKESTCKVSCDIHGNGWEWEDRKWEPIVHTLIKGIGCPKCGFENHHLDSLLKNPEYFNQERFLYFIKFKHNNKVFFKIGITSHENIHLRYPKHLLNKHDIEFKVQEHFKTTNINALLTEFYILKKFNDKRSYKKIMKDSTMDGATECFDTNITKNKGLKSLMEKAISDIDFWKVDFKNHFKNNLTRTELNRLYNYLNDNRN